ncbi:unnamed protein product [Nesidiocoris tenuis]|uniref:Uncharacterized protein n=1 Tax=Nesidiocoris tenuis TaxID=355587 RepID=A0A6H5GWZ6_9HEMI|nr:unnamed protein product [Nesidiocoris tenuis]
MSQGIRHMDQEMVSHSRQHPVYVQGEISLQSRNHGLPAGFHRLSGRRSQKPAVRLQSLPYRYHVLLRRRNQFRTVRMAGCHFDRYARAQSDDSSSESGSKMFGSLKKLGRRDKHDKEKESKEKDGSTGGSSLDRKCLRILGTGPLPVPTAQYRSYRRVHNAPPLPPPSICPPNKDFQDQPPQQPHTALPPEMADYRLASLTAKTTPPVPSSEMLD